MRNDFCKTKPLWGATATWQTVNRNLDYLIRLHRAKMDRAVALARDVQIRL